MQTRLKPICLIVMQALACMAYANPVPGASPAPDPQAAADAPAAAEPAAAVLVETFGRGQSRQVQNISRSDLNKLLPGTSALKALEKLPGVSFQSADAFGIYEWSTRLSIRGFSQNQLGFTLDNLPLGDMSYGNNNGLHISRAISTENIGRVAVSQGAGSLATASTSNLGGTVQFFTLNPTDAMGTTISQTIGSDSTSRTFARFDSGETGSGAKFFVSGTRQRTEKWKGFGGQDQNQFNSKVMYPIGDHTLSAFYNYSDRSEHDYQDLSLDLLKRTSYNWDNYAPDWKRAVDSANGIFSGGANNMDDGYYLGRGLRKDGLGGLALDLDFGSITIKTSLYRHSNRGQGHWYTPYTRSSPTVPIAIRTSEYRIERSGLISELGWDIGKHEIKAGVWREQSDHGFTRNFYAVTGPDDTNRFLSNPMTTGFKQQFDTVTTQFSLQDTISLLDKRFKINLGFKSPKVTTDTVSLVGTRAAGSITASKSFLPQVGLMYTINKDNEVFASASQNMRAFQPGTVGPFSQTQTAFNLGKQNLKPETSNSFDLGLRFRHANLQGSVAVYRADFSDRQLSVATCAGISGCPSTLVNVGKVATRGIEAIGVWRFGKEVTWFNAATYNSSVYESDYLDNGKTVTAGGKDVVDTPRKMLTSELTYETGAWYARVGAKYTDRRYYTFLNDGQVPSYVVAGLATGYKFPAMSIMKEWGIQLHVTNLFDKRHMSTIGSNGFVKSDATGSYATLQAGAPRQVFVTVSGKI